MPATTPPQMDVLYLNFTGHVLAIFTRASEPPKIETDPSTFLGDGFHLRGWGDKNAVAAFKNQEFVIPVNQIGLLRTDLNPRNMAAPRQYQVSLPVATPPVLGSLAAPPALTYAALSFSPLPAPSTPYMILIYGPTPTSAPATPVQILQNTNAVSGLTSGSTYFAILFATGQQPSPCSFTF